jgi:ABC-2 type transport system permease protein
MVFVFPLFFAGITLLPTIITGMVPAEDQKIGYVDMTGSLNFPKSVNSGDFPTGPTEVKTSTIYFIMYKDDRDAKNALQARNISSYLVIPEDFLKTGIIELYSVGNGGLSPQAELSNELSNIVINSLLKDKVSELILNRVKDPVKIKAYLIGENGVPSEEGLSELFTNFGLPFLTAFLLFVSIFSASGYFLRGVAEEKENRIMEILLSSATPSELLTGKILGLCAVGLLQIGIWLSAIALLSGITLSVKVEPLLLLLSLIYFLLGFLFFAGIMAGIGAITNSLQESQQLSAIFTVVATLPLMFIGLILARPASSIAVFLSLFPFTSSVSMLVRIGASDVPVYQIFASILILIISTCAVIVISSRLFRAYLLMYGRKPGVKEIWKTILAGDK